MRGLASWWDRLPRPLDPFASFKVKMGLVVGGAITLAAFTFWVGASWQFRYALLAALATSLVLTQFLAHGMTSPLRHMAAAARAMARGDYSRRVRATSRDEVGQLATAFNQMAADLGAADEYRRGLIANVSHELRTPIAALHAVLENVVDGVAQPDPETMRMALAQTERLGELVANLLDLSRLEGGAIPLQLSPFRVDEFLHEAVGLVALSPHGVDVVVPGLAARPGRRGRPCAAAAGGGQPRRQRDSGTARRVAGCRCSGGAPSRRDSDWRCATRGREFQRPSASGYSNASVAGPPPRAVPASAWQSPGGQANCTVAQSKSWATRRVVALGSRSLPTRRPRSSHDDDGPGVAHGAPAATPDARPGAPAARRARLDGLAAPRLAASIRWPWRRVGSSRPPSRSACSALRCGGRRCSASDISSWESWCSAPSTARPDVAPRAGNGSGWP